jgi:hypothetical protein
VGCEEGKMKAYTLILVVLLLPNSTGCAAFIAAGALQNHHNRKWQEMEYRHQEKMRELDIQERRFKQNPPPQTTDGGIVRETPF